MVSILTELASGKFSDVTCVGGHVLGVRETTAIVPKPLIGSSRIDSPRYGCDQTVSSLQKSSGPARLTDW